MEVNAHGAAVRIRSPLAVFLLSTITLGIYGAVWYHQVNRELRDFGAAAGDRELASVRPGRSVLAVTLGSILIIPAIVSLYRFIGRVRAVERRGGTRLTSGWLVLLLAIAGLVALLPGFAIAAYVQGDLNELWRGFAPEEPTPRQGRWERITSWVRGEERPLRAPPEWLFRPAIGLIYLAVTIGLLFTSVWPIDIALVVFFALQVYEDCRVNDLSRLWWPSTAGSPFGPLAFLAYMRSRRETLESRAAAPALAATPQAAGLPPAGWYPDPLGEPAVRYWDGARWTHDLRR